ncbi:Major facilitator superfamily domain-containing protein 8 [Aphelenchoides besseyi]|nr:Major facilitator superfamily domain-containing protein 8 [Aphelenchoides besseyi]KAI6209814.1 Major facilitator superfamily domain-containing protein 8 [Aphelenchoides besseyi]
MSPERRRSSLRKGTVDEQSASPVDVANGVFFSNDEEYDEESEQKVKTPWKSIAVAASLATCSALQFSLYISSTWPYLQILDPNTTVWFFGLIISAYSCGQILGAPILGLVSNRLENIRIPVNICLVLCLIGNMAYVLAQLFPEHSRYIVMFSRFIVGIGSSNISLLKSFVSMSSTSEERSRALALCTGGVAIGSMTGPAIIVIFTSVGYPGWHIYGRFWLSMYTIPGVFACVINICGMIALWTLFVEDYAGLAPKTKRNNSDETEKLPKYDLLAIFLVHVTIFSQRFTYVNLETLGPIIGQTVFSWTREQVVFRMGIAHSCLSFLALGINVLFVSFKMEKILNFRIACLSAVCGLIVFHLITFSWPFLGGSLTTYSQEEYDAAITNGSELIGCNVDRFAWCETTKPMNVWVYYVAYVLFIGTCFPSINITLNTIFSKIIGPRRMSAEQGLLMTTGSCARLIAPLLISNLFTSMGPRASWILEIAVLSTVVVLWFKLYDRMVPLKIPEKQFPVPPLINSIKTQKLVNVCVADEKQTIKISTV